MRLACFTLEDHAYGSETTENDCFAVYCVRGFSTLFYIIVLKSEDFGKFCG